MTRVNFVVEGQTEEGFVKQVLYPYLFMRNIISTPRLVRLKSSGGSIVRGGIRNYEQPKLDIQQWLRLDTYAYCTTMFVFYALPKDFPAWIRFPQHPHPIIGFNIWRIHSAQI